MHKLGLHIEATFQHKTIKAGIEWSGAPLRRPAFQTLRVTDKAGAAGGKNADVAVQAALEADEPYDLICLDIMMLSALGDLKNVKAAYGSLCDACLVKPIEKAKLMEELRSLALVT